MNRKKGVILLFLLYAFVLLAGCQPAGKDTDTFTIGVSYDSESAFPNKWVTAIENVCQQQDVQVITVSAGHSPSKQISDIERLIAQQVDVAVVRPKNTGSIITALRYLKEANIPCILIDFPIDEQYSDLYDVFLCEDSYQEGKLQADFMKEWMQKNPLKEVQIAYFSGPYERQNSLLKRDAFYEELGIEAPAYEECCNWSIVEAIDATERCLKTHPEINAFVCMNDDMAAGVVQALRSAGKNLDNYLVMGIDGNSDYKSLLLSGEINCTIVRDLEKESMYIIDIAKGLAQGTQYEKTIYPDSIFILTQENAQAYFENKDE